ncbi:MAG: hypothetical protein WCL14_07740 [Bacteroidota bacterium]
MKKIILMFLISMTIGLVHAQTVSENDLPEAVSKKFKKMYKTVTDADWSQTGDNFKATFELNKLKNEIVMDEKGNIVEKKEAVAIATLPQPISPYMSKNHKGFKIKEAYKITDDKKAVTYEVHSKNKAGDEAVALFDGKGKFLSDVGQ